MKIIKFDTFTATITRIVCDKFTKTIHVNININDFYSRVILFNFVWNAEYISFIELDDHLDIFPLDKIREAVKLLILNLRTGIIKIYPSN